MFWFISNKNKYHHHHQLHLDQLTKSHQIKCETNEIDFRMNNLMEKINMNAMEMKKVRLFFSNFLTSLNQKLHREQQQQPKKLLIK